MKAANHVLGNGAIARKTVFVSVTEALAGRVPGILPTTPLEDIARGFWYVNDKKIIQCELLVAVDKNIVRGVWEIDMVFKWHPMSMAAIPTRNLTTVIIDPNRKYCRVKSAVSSELNGKRLSSIWPGMRMYGPVQYNF